MAELNAVLTGTSQGLENALENVKEATRDVATALEGLDETVENIQESFGTTSKSVDKADESLDDFNRSALTSSESADALDRSIEGILRSSVTLRQSVDSLGDKIDGLALSSAVAGQTIDEVGDEALNSSLDLAALSSATGKASGSMGQAAVMAQVLQGRLDEAGDEADDATGELLGTAGAAELLSLQSSALSINVGLFTVALRNLTTQVPLLVTSLGNLTAAFSGLAGAVGAVGLGGAAVALGGMAAKAEQVAGPLEGAGDHMAALGEMADDIKLRFIEALQPLLNAEGVVEAFEDSVDGAVEATNILAESIATAFSTDAFEGVEEGTQLQSLETTLRGVGSSIMDNLEPITHAIENMVFQLGDDIERVAETILSGLPGFIENITVATEEMLSIFAVAGENLGPFVSELTNFGRTIGAGIAPVINIFLDVISDIVSELNELPVAAVSSIAMAGALLLAVNRLGGALGSLLTPLTQVVQRIGVLATQQAAGPISALVGGFASMLNPLTQASSGINKLSDAFEMMLPPIGENTSLLSSLTGSAKSADKSLLSLLSSTSDTSAETGTLSHRLSTLSDGLSQVQNKARSVVSGALPSLSDRLPSISDFDINEAGANFSPDPSRFAVGGGGSRNRKMPIQRLTDRVRNSENRLISTLGNVRKRTGSRLTSIVNTFRKFDINEAAANFNPDENVFSVSGGGRNRKMPIQRLADRARKSGNNLISTLGDIKRKSGSRLTSILSQFRKFDINEAAANFNPDGSFLTNLSPSPDLSGVKKSFAALTGTTVVAAESTEELNEELAQAAVSANLSTDAAEDLKEGIEQLGGREEIAKLSTDQLKEKIEEMGFSARKTELAVDSLEDELGEYSTATTTATIKTKIMSGVVGGLTSVMKILALSTLALTGGLIALVAIVGTAGAILQKLGESGKDAGDIIDDLKSIIMDLGAAVMPFVRESTELMLDIFNSLIAVFSEVFSAVQEVLVSLGLIKEPVDDGKEGIDALISAIKSFSKSIAGILEKVGKFARIISGVLIINIRKAKNVLVTFFNAINAAAIIDTLIKAFKILAGAVLTVTGLLLQFKGVLVPLLQVLGITVGILAAVKIGMLAVAAASSILSGSLGLLTKAQTALNIAMSMNPLGAMATAIVLIIAGVTVLLKKLGLLTEAFNAILKVVQFVANVIRKITNFIIGLVNAISKFFTGAKALNKLDDKVTLEVESGSQQKASGAAMRARPDAAKASNEALKTGADVAQEGVSRAAGMGTNPNVNVEEGDTTNIFNQDISADPEDEPQIGRIAKDAMREANSFERRTEGN